MRPAADADGDPERDQRPSLDGADEPLIAADDDGQPRSDGDDREDDEPGAGATWFAWQLSLTAALSGLQFGYDTGVISATLVAINADLSARPLTAADKSLITAITSLFALLASPLAAPLADALGRRRALLAADAAFALGCGAQALARTVGAMAAGRAAVGVGVGVASAAAPLLVGESCPAAHRGRLVALQALAVTAGQAVAYAVGWALVGRGHERVGGGGWRALVALGAAPALVQAGMLLAGVAPESPRWLVGKGRGVEARRVLERVYGGGGAARALVTKLEREVGEEREADGGKGVRGALAELLGRPDNRRALGVACMLQAAQQLCGFNTLMYFSATIFAMVGFRQPTATAMLVALTNFAFTVAALLVIDRVGRRRILLASIPVMSLGLFLSAVAFTHVDLVPHPSPSTPVAGAPWPVLLVASLLLFVAAYALGLGNVPWQQAELFTSLRVRAAGAALATATNWGCNFVVAASFLPMLGALGAPPTMLVYAAVCAVTWVGVWWTYPERAGVGLEVASSM